MKHFKQNYINEEYKLYLQFLGLTSVYLNSYCNFLWFAPAAKHINF